MFEDMGFINTYKIDLHTLARSDGRTVKNCVYPSPAVQAERRLISVVAWLHRSLKEIN